MKIQTKLGICVGLPILLDIILLWILGSAGKGGGATAAISPALFWLLLVVLLVIIGIAICVIYRHIVVPLGSIVKATEAMTMGDFSASIETQSEDEIGKIATAFRSIAHTLQRKADAAEAMARGDLTVEPEILSPMDRIGIALKAMVDNLNVILGRIKYASDQVAAGSAQISEASQSLSQGASESAASIQEITSSMNELGGRTRTNAENSAQANQLATVARTSAEQGNQQMKAMIASMAEINASSQQISKIIKVIDDIAFQTNLLALNAAVEAARAGRHGKGFAVVAEEVRNLAGRSAKAARETGELIESAVRKTSDGTAIANKTSEALAEIMNGVVKVSDLIGEIAAASNEQAQGIAQVNEGLAQIDKVTQKNTAHAEETSSSAQELARQAEELKRILAPFRLRPTEGYASATAIGSPVAPLPYASPALPTPPAMPPVPRASRPAAAAAPTGWGGVPATTGDRIVKPQDVIALDDKEFGKY